MNHPKRPARRMVVGKRERGEPEGGRGSGCGELTATGRVDEGEQEAGSGKLVTGRTAVGHRAPSKRP